MDKYVSGSAVISLNEFQGVDDNSRLSAAIEYCRTHLGCTLIVPPGDYILRSTHATNVMNNVMRGAYGINAQEVLFKADFIFDRGLDLSGLRDTVIDGTGARLLADGYWEVISIRDAENVTVRGFVIDHIRRPYSRGTVEKIENEWITIQLAAEYPITPQTPLGLRQCLYDFDNEQLFALRVQETIVKNSHTIMCRTEQPPHSSWLGMYFYTVHCYHSCPAILVENSSDINICDVTIHSHHGMGVVGHRVQDLHMEECRIVPAEGEFFFG